MQIPDSTICSLLNQGEEKGMEYLFTRYYKPLVLWAASFLNNIPQSEDLVQDFFIRLWEKRTQTSLQATTFKSFLYTSVRNLAFDRMEKKDPLRHATDLKSSDKAWEEYDTLEEEVLARVKNEIDKLPERSRQIMQCIYLQGLPKISSCFCFYPTKKDKKPKTQKIKFQFIIIIFSTISKKLSFPFNEN